MAYGFGGAVADFGFSWLRGPAFILSITLTREGAAGQAVVCPLLRGSSPTRGVAPKQHRGAPACFLSGISGWFSLSLGAWVPNKLARRSKQNKAIADQSPLLKLSLRRVRFQRTSTRQQLDCAKTL